MSCQGLVDEAELAQDAPAPKTLQDPQLELTSSGRIGAFYPDDGHAKVKRVVCTAVITLKCIQQVSKCIFNAHRPVHHKALDTAVLKPCLFLHDQAATKNVYDVLRARLEATSDRLLQGQLDEDVCEEASAAASEKSDSHHQGITPTWLTS
jgi:hypothetical protein